MAFAVPGLLGSFAKFRRRYLGAEATTDSDRIARLRTIVAPFMLRRTKHDKSVVPDLPDKIALRHDCALTREQIGIYEAIATKMEAQLGNASGTARRGMILAGLTRLKACVHPQLARGTHENGLRTTSGKLTELIELATQAIDEGDALIVFTQYASFIAPLADYLAGQAQINSLPLHGSMSRSARTKAVDRFTDEGGPPVLLASLKAGGTGLNLVRASHVVHLDRWWNPAVEDQGSDRAWRIGQTSTVMVHSLVCPGTIEERIADVLARKRATASSISAPESSPAVTELSDEDLHDLVTLVRAETLLLRSS
jgi:SNF2 family DNA or RNA helicase